jgi:hypothetical protein
MATNDPSIYTSLHHVTAESVKVGATAVVVRIGPSLEVYADSYAELVTIGEEIARQARKRIAELNQSKAVRIMHPAGGVA